MPDPPSGVKKRACDLCHRRKIRCDRTPPQCNWCKHHGLVCTFDRPFGRRKRANEIALVTPPSPDGATPSPTPDHVHDAPAVAEGNTRPSAGLGGFYFAGIHLGGISSQNGIPFFSERGRRWIQERVGSGPALHWPRPADMAMHQPPTRIEGAWELPDRSMVDVYFHIFFKSSLRYVFPIIDDASFVGIVQRAYDTRRDAHSLSVIRAKACVLSFTAVMIHMEGKIDQGQSVNDSQCAIRAENLIPHALAEPNSESLQVCTMLSMYHIYSGNTSAAGTYLSIACRFALMLGAHLQPVAPLSGQNTNSTQLAKVHLRGLFWLCYMFDKDMCLRAGYPPVIDDDHCDLTLPPGYKQIGTFDDFRDGSDIFPGDMRLSIIKSNAIRLLYCKRAFRKSDAELLRDIRELDDELEAWRMSIPHLHRPTLACTYMIHLQPDFNKPKKVHLIVIHLEYYFLLALFHTASGRCRWASGEGDKTASVTSSQALALQASRSTILNLAAAADVFNCGDFWFFVLYPVFASLTIFCNIVLSPLNPVAKQDVQLLEQVPRIIEGLRARRMHQGDGARVRQVQDFLVELVRLAKLAMENAH